MKGSPEVIKSLQGGVALEAHLNEQYRSDRDSLKHAGIKKAAGKIKGFAHQAHLWRSMIRKQLLFETSDGTTVEAGATAFSIPVIADRPTLTQLFQGELVENQAICAQYERNIPIAMAALDDETRNLWEHLIKWHHGHIRWIEAQLRAIASYASGESDYRTTQV
jgi:bacterioferritin (cytochrome b1)